MLFLNDLYPCPGEALRLFFSIYISSGDSIIRISSVSRSIPVLFSPQSCPFLISEHEGILCHIQIYPFR